ncbi:MAG: signal peptidase I [Armatimonadetes bacterium]|nr:signal peptidase I [Armatimonadota bacterium]
MRNTVRKRTWLHWAVYTFLACTVAFFVWLNYFSPFLLVRVTGRSMQPTLMDGSWCLADKRVGVIAPLDVVVFRVAGQTYVKRVVATEGNYIPVKYVFAEGNVHMELVDTYHVSIGAFDDWFQIPEGYLWVESDFSRGIGSEDLGMPAVQDVIATIDTSTPPDSFWYSAMVREQSELESKPHDHVQAR